MAPSSSITIDAASLAAPSAALCLDFANTVAWRGSAPDDSLYGFGDLLRWCRARNFFPAGALRAFEVFARRAHESAAVFEEAILLRESIYRIFFAASDDRSPVDADLRRFNRALRRGPIRNALDRVDHGFAWRIERAAVCAPTMLAPVLWSAADLLAGSSLTRVRHCANDQCGWLFLDDSKNGTRRWCSMSSCGNRAKAHRHYLRRMRD